MVIGLRRPLILICFLEVAELNLLNDWLENLAGTCALGILSETESSNTTVKADHGFRERIDVSADFSRLLFDERYLKGEIGDDRPDDDGSAVTFMVKTMNRMIR
ncbi:hypothetical protein SLA2020_414460 [Shorea laevis]